MSPKTITRLAAVLAVLVVATIAAAILTQPPRPPAFTGQGVPERITRIEIETPAGKIELKREKTSWSASAPAGYPADGRTIDEILAKLPEATLSDALTEDPERYAMFGFGASSATHVRLHAGNETVLDFYVGKAGPNYPSAFVRIAKQTGVVQVSGITAEDWTRAPGDWLDRTIAGGMSESVRGVSVRGPKGSWELKRSNEGWSVGGKPVPADAVERSVRPVTEAAGQLEADSVLGAAASPKDMGLEKPELVVKAETKTGSFSFSVGKKDPANRRYVRKEGEARVVFLVADWKLDPLRKSPADFFKK